MGFFSKLNPFKKKDDFDDLGKDLGLGDDFGKGFGKDLGMGDMSAGQDLGPSPDLGMGLDMPAGGPGQQPFQKYSSYNPSPSFQAPQYSPPQFSASSGSNDGYINTKNLEVISSKLDALRAAIGAMNQRLANIEAIARGEQEEQRGRRRYY